MNSVLRVVPAKAQKKILKYASAIQTVHTNNNDFLNKLKAMDEAYYRYSSTSEDENGECDTASGAQDIEVPLAVSEVSTTVAHLQEVFLSQYPLFPVVAPEKWHTQGKVLETKIASDAIRGRWSRQLLMSFKNAAKYNVAGIEFGWEPVSMLSIDNDTNTMLNDTAKVNVKVDYINKLKATDMYNTFWDLRYAPADIVEKGEYAGYNELVSKPELKKFLNTISIDKEAMNVGAALKSCLTDLNSYWNDRPILSKYAPQTQNSSSNSWLHWVGQESIVPDTKYYDNYLKTVIYARIIPEELGVVVPNLNHPQIWKFVIINMDTVVYAKRIITPYDYLPILFIDLEEDQFGTQTQSIEETILPYQDSATEFLNIRLASGRRAIGDKGIYNPKLITKANINASGATSKTPVETDNYQEAPDLGQAYRPTPYDHGSTAGTIGDMNTVIQMAEKITANNSAAQGQFRKGNRTLGEYQDIMGNAGGRQRTHAMLVEDQVMVPIKQMAKSNILQFSSEEMLVAQEDNPQGMQIDIGELRNALMDFQIGDGQTPKEKMLSSEVFQIGMQAIASDPELNQSYDKGAMLVKLMLHAGNIDLSQYKRKVPLDATQPAPQQTE